MITMCARVPEVIDRLSHVRITYIETSMASAEPHLTLSTEPIGSIPRLLELMKAYVAGTALADAMQTKGLRRSCSGPPA
jgi:hypothetical protein